MISSKSFTYNPVNNAKFLLDLDSPFDLPRVTHDDVDSAFDFCEWVVGYFSDTGDVVIFHRDYKECRVTCEELNAYQDVLVDIYNFFPSVHPLNDVWECFNWVNCVYYGELNNKEYFDLP